MERELENDNPSLLAICQEFLEFVLYTYYPKEIYEDEYGLYGAAIQYYISTLQSIEVDIEDLEIAYQVEGESIEDILLALKTIEC
jgi:hypothetical protein